jgi:hypothetical protein
MVILYFVKPIVVKSFKIFHYLILLLNKNMNIFGEPLKLCPVTGYNRKGFCNLSKTDTGYVQLLIINF